jgi:prepilin-type N-terminal cleavage/methylation domain-containing protein
MKKNKQGFTLVELLVVIAILGILMAVFVPKIADALSSANVTAMVNKGK